MVEVGVVAVVSSAALQNARKPLVRIRRPDAQTDERPDLRRLFPAKHLTPTNQQTGKKIEDWDGEKKTTSPTEIEREEKNSGLSARLSRTKYMLLFPLSISCLSLLA